MSKKFYSNNGYVDESLLNDTQREIARSQQVINNQYYQYQQQNNGYNGESGNQFSTSNGVSVTGRSRAHHNFDSQFNSNYYSQNHDYHGNSNRGHGYHGTRKNKHNNENNNKSQPAYNDNNNYQYGQYGQYGQYEQYEQYHQHQQHQQYQQYQQYQHYEQYGQYGQESRFDNCSNNKNGYYYGNEYEYDDSNNNNNNNKDGYGNDYYYNDYYYNDYNDNDYWCKESWNEISRKDNDGELGVLGIPFEYDKKDGEPKPLTPSDCLNLKKGDIIWTLDESDTFWERYEFESVESVDKNKQSLILVNLMKQQKFIRLEFKMMPIMFLQPPKKEKTEKTEKKECILSKNENRKETNLKFDKDIVGESIAITFEAACITYEIVEYDRKTSKCLLKTVDGLTTELRLDQFEHEFLNNRKNDQKLDIESALHLPKCKDLEWNHGKCELLLNEIMDWKYYKNSLLKSLSVATIGVKKGELDYRNLMVTSGDGLSYYWSDYNGNNNEEEIISEKNNNKKLINGRELNDIFEEHSNLLLCDSQIVDRLTRISAFTKYDITIINVAPTLLASAPANQNINVVETFAINSLNNGVGILTQDMEGHIGVIVGYCLKKCQNNKNSKHGNTSYYFKLKKMVAIDEMNEEIIDNDNKKMNEFEYSTIDLKFQKYIILLPYKKKGKERKALIDRMDIKLINDSLTQFIDQFESGSVTMCDNDESEVEIKDLVGKDAFDEMLANLNESINGTLNMKNEYDVKQDQLLLRKIIYSLIRLTDGRHCMHQFFDKLYACDAEIERVKGGLKDAAANVKALCQNETDIIDKCKLNLIEKYVKNYDGKPLKLMFNEWLNNENECKESIYNILNDIKKLEFKIVDECKNIVKLLQRHMKENNDNDRNENYRKKSIEEAKQ